MGLARGSLLFSATVFAHACGAVYPQVATPLRAVPAGRVLDPPPPEGILYVELEGATIPRRTRDGLPWDTVGGPAPDPYAIVILDGERLFRTSTERDTFTPTWSDAPKRNHAVTLSSVLRVELWHDNPVNAHPICLKDLRNLRRAALEDGGIQVTCDGGAEFRVVLRGANARFGVGLVYELRSEGVYVKESLQNSPAQRAGLTKGQRILTVMGKPVDSLSPSALRSLINSNVSNLDLGVSSGGMEHQVKVAEGPIYGISED